MHTEDPTLHSGVPTAFRTAEKLYRLPPPVQGRHRKKLRGAGLGVPAEAPQPLDFRLPEQIQQLLVYSTADRSVSPHTVYGLQTHPGFFFLPSSVPPRAQRSFLEDIAGQLLEPPAAKNLTAAHGALPGLWRAAAEGLRLRTVAAQSLPAPGARSSDTPAADTAYKMQQQPCSSDQCPTSLRHGATHAPAAAAQNCSAGSFESTWSADGVGATAAALLRKLRWLTVGPRYDWTDRVYDFNGPYHPLPAYATALATGLVSATEQAVQSAVRPQQRQHHAQQGDATATAVCPCQATGAHRQPLAVRHHQSCECRHSQLRQSDSQTSASSMLTPGLQTQVQPGRSEQPPSRSPTQQASHVQQQAADPQRSGIASRSQHTAAPAQQQQQQLHQMRDEHDTAQAFVPDAALVCFYRAGDTLCGHRDDVERDLSQPIVSLSLGCTAILLLGGRSRCDPPTPLLVRHGDAVVFSGPARMYYHGVPRVFNDGPGEDELRELGSLSPALRDFVQHNRINISMRSVS